VPKGLPVVDSRDAWRPEPVPLRSSAVERLVSSPWAWTFVLSFVACVSLSTIRISPILWQDEAQIIDYGRVAAFDSASDWGMNWTKGNRPHAMLAPFGAILQEVAFRISGLDPIGPRVSSLLGALLASTLLLLWLRSRGTQSVTAFCLSLLFLVDPLLAQSYKGGRVDGWAMAAAFSAGLLFRRPTRIHHFLAGALAAFGIFLWPSAFLLLPLLFLELATAVLPIPPLSPYQRLKKLWPFTVGLVASGAIFLSASLALQGVGARQLIELLSTTYQAHAGKNVQYASTFRGTLTATIDTLKLSPFIWISAFVCSFQRRNIVLAAFTVSVWILVLLTVVYPFRVVYLVPYALMLIAEYSRSISRSGSARRSVYVLVGAPLVSAVLLTLVARPVVAFLGRAERSPDTVYQIAKVAIGPKSTNVFVDCWEFYFPGRRLGWHMYNPYGAAKDHSLAILANSTYAVLSPDGAASLQKELSEAGMREVARFSTAGRTQPRFGSRTYGPYVFFRR